MANSRQTNNINSSMIDLKAELFRKQEEYKQLKAEKASDFVKGIKTNSTKHGKGDIWSRKNCGVLERASKDMAQKEEEDNVMERSRKALEAKSKIYDKINSTSGIPDEDGSEGYLVDFQKKAVDRIVEQRRAVEKDGMSNKGKMSGHSMGHSSSDEEFSNNEPVPLPANSGEEWVDYTDTFGRSRRCMRKDLPDLQRQERPLGRPAGDDGLKLKEGASFLSADMKRELRRQKWEKETEEAADGPVHYSNVQFDEIRTHGTGYYQFSKDSNLREEQMDMLNKLREQTMDNRMRSERIKEKRKAALEARLAKVKQRRKMKDGSATGLQDKDETEDAASQVTTASGATQEVKEAEPLTRDDSWRQSAPVREWDVGKPKLPEWNAKRYMEERRSERESEFAPPQFYYDKRQPNITSATSSAPLYQAGAKTPARLVGPAVQATSSSVDDKTDIMLKQIRQSVRSSPATSKTVYPNTKTCEEKGATSPVSDIIDLGAIPLPQVGPQHDITHSSQFSKVADRRNLDPNVQCFDTCDREFQQQSLSVNQNRDYFQAQIPVQGQGQACPSSYGGQIPDMSMPPPGWYPPTQPQSSLAQPVPGIDLQCKQTIASSGSTDSSFHTEQAPASSFVYPSQQGLLSSQVKQSSSQSIISAQIPAPKSAVSKASIPKMNMVDKRFMQNREVSDEDLLGYMAQSSADPLVKVEAVSYTPGIFSSAAASQLSDKARSSSQDVEEVSDIPAAQTQGVIFGVPDFLQPASNVVATTYTPGSFMAAKEMAAHKAEEGYEAARKKKEYSSAPVLYCQPDDDTVVGLESAGSAREMKQEQQSEVECEEDDEYSRFMKEVQSKT